MRKYKIIRTWEIEAENITEAIDKSKEIPHNKIFVEYAE